MKLTEIDEAIDRLKIMADKITAKDYLPKELSNSLKKDKDLLLALSKSLSALKDLYND